MYLMLYFLKNLSPVFAYIIKIKVTSENNIQITDAIQDILQR